MEADVLCFLGIEALPDLFEAGFHETVTIDASEPLSVLIQLFLLGRTTELKSAEGCLGTVFLEKCFDCGLIRRTSNPSEAIALVSIHPATCEGVSAWLAFDRMVPGPAEGLHPSADMVYPTITPSALQFLRYLPRRNVGRFLEVCAGCGCQAASSG